MATERQTGMNYIDSTIIEGSAQPMPEHRPAAFDTARLLRRLLRGSPVIVLFLLGGLYLGHAAMHWVPARYTSSASILIDPKRPGALGGETSFGNVFIDSSKIANVEVVLLSTRLLEKVVRDEHLADVVVPPEKPSWLHRYLPFLGGERARAPDTQAARDAGAVEVLRQMIHTGRVGMTYVIKLDVTARSPEQAQRLAEAVANAYLEEQVNGKLEAAKSDSAWLTDHLQTQRKELIRSEAAVEALRRQYGIMGGSNGADSTVDRQSITQVNEELVKAQGDVAVAGAHYEQAKHLLRSGGSLEGLPDIAASPVIASLRQQQSEAARRVATLSQRYASGYPELRQAQLDRDAINRQVSMEVSRVIGQLQNTYETAVAHRDALQKELNGLVGSVNASANAEARVELREAERVAEANRVAYEASLSRLREVEQLESRQDSEASIISDADLPDQPSFPKPMIFISGGGVLGLLIGFGLVLLVPLGGAKVDDVNLAERDFVLPVLSMAPYLSERQLRVDGRLLAIPDYVRLNPFSRFSESLRILRLRLRPARARSARVIQITSAIPGEGKSTIAASIAISAAAAGSRTVLVDLDLHHPSAGKLLGNTRAAGVVDLLLGSAAPGTALQTQDALQTHDALPISTISAGSIKSMNPGLLEGEHLRKLIAQLSEDFDLVILDTPPVLAICDPLYISELVDATVMVVAWRATPQACVDDALSALRGAGAPLAGIFLNKVNFAKTGRYGKSYGYDKYQTA
jgi:capsular exopolysaccharide synthesis family protein